MPATTDTGQASKVNPKAVFDRVLEDVLKARRSQPMPDPSGAVMDNPAIVRCCLAHNGALQAANANKESDYAAEKSAKRAYRSAMPPLSGRQNIRDFIACIAHGMLMGVIRESEGTKLLYAAQIAYSASNTPAVPRSPGRPRNETPADEK